MSKEVKFILMYHADGKQKFRNYS